MLEAVIRRAPPKTSPNVRRILVADDESSVRYILTRALGDFGYVVDAVSDGAEAWDALRATHYDLMVTDNNMPRFSGVQLLQKLRAENKTVPVIMVTGGPVEEILRQEPSLQPAAVLLKPFTIANLLATVDRHLHQADEPVRQ